MNKKNNNKFSFSFKQLSDVQKKALLKLLGILALIIAVFTVLSKTSFFSGETLAEYAQNNPDLAYKESVVATEVLDEAPETE